MPPPADTLLEFSQNIGLTEELLAKASEEFRAAYP